MAEFYPKLRVDLVEQFRDKPYITALVEVIARQLDEVQAFYDQLRTERGIYTAVGKQLDGIGDIVSLNRLEAGILMGDPIPVDILNDDDYRKYLIFKIMKNTSDGSYPDVVKAIRMLYNGEFRYQEDPNVPATIFLDVERFKFNDIETLLNLPIIKAGGVQIRFRANANIESRIYAGAIMSMLRSETFVQEPYDMIEYLIDEDGNILCDEDGLILHEGGKRTEWQT